MGLQESGAKIIENVGGAANINSFTHCATRLRFGLKDDSKANIDEIKSVKEVLDVVNKGGQLQVIIGPAVSGGAAMKNAMQLMKASLKL